jgi:hypothetical protein
MTVTVEGHVVNQIDQTVFKAAHGESVNYMNNERRLDLFQHHQKPLEENSQENLIA